MVAAYLDRIRRSRPNASPMQVVELLETRYKQAAMGVGAASGGIAAVPGVGTAASVAAGGAEIAAFVSATALYVLALARVYGIPTHDPDVRRALVFGVLLGEGSLVVTEGPELPASTGRSSSTRPRTRTSSPVSTAGSAAWRCGGSPPARVR